jgi:hypothetical protein
MTFSSGSQVAQYLIHVAAFTDTIKYTDNTGTHTILSSGSAVSGETFGFTAVGSFSLEIFNGSTSYFSNSGFQAFAVFQDKTNPGTLYVGSEDAGSGGDRDYNDVVFTLASVPTPEPASLALCLTGLVSAMGGAYFRRRRQK